MYHLFNNCLSAPCPSFYTPLYNAGSGTLQTTCLLHKLVSLWLCQQRHQRETGRLEKEGVRLFSVTPFFCDLLAWNSSSPQWQSAFHQQQLNPVCSFGTPSISLISLMAAFSEAKHQPQMPFTLGVWSQLLGVLPGLQTRATVNQAPFFKD